MTRFQITFIAMLLMTFSGPARAKTELAELSQSLVSEILRPDILHRLPRFETAEGSAIELSVALVMGDEQKSVKILAFGNIELLITAKIAAKTAGYIRVSLVPQKVHDVLAKTLARLPTPNQPFVAYIWVDPAFRGLGVAEALHLSAAFYLSQLPDPMALFSSTLEDPRETRVWERLVQNGFPVQARGGRKVLDFRLPASCGILLQRDPGIAIPKR